MKKQYIAPEAKLLCFVAQQQLASAVEKEFDDLLDKLGGGDSNNGFGEAVTPSGNDIGLDIF